MDLCQTRAPVEAPSTQPLALHEFLGQKTPPLIVSYHYTYDTMCPSSTEGEEAVRSDECQASHQASHQEQPAGLEQNVRSFRPESSSWRSSSPSSSQNEQGLLPPTNNDGDEHQKQETRTGGSPRDQSQPSPPDPPVLSSWQAARRQLSSGYTDSGKATNWIRGWSMSVSECGAETVCACGDNLAMTDIASTPSLPAKKQFSVKMTKRLSRGVKSGGTRDSTNHKQSQNKDSKRNTLATATVPSTSTPPTAPAVCQSCGRPIVPVTKPEDRDGGNIPGLIQLPRWMKGVLRRLPGHDHGRSGRPERDLATGLAKLKRTNVENVAKGGLKNGTQPTPVLLETSPRNGTHQPHADHLPSDEDEPQVTPNLSETGLRDRARHPNADCLPSDEDEPEVDPDQLSESSGEGVKPSRAIAERQARLRRAQMLLAKTNPRPGDTPRANRG